MKKTLLLVIGLLFIVANQAGAQKLGFIGGPSLSHGNIWCSDDIAIIKPMPGAGFHVGGLFEWDITNRWGWDVAAMYEMRSSSFNFSYNRDTSTYFNRQLFYLNIPAHVYVNFPIQNKYVISAFVGPVFTCGLHGRDIAWEMTDLKKPVTYEKEKMFDKDAGRVVRCEIAAEIGLAFKYKNFQGRASYQYGINNSTKDDYRYTMPLPTGTKTYYTQGTLKLSFAYLFDLRK